MKRNFEKIGQKLTTTLLCLSLLGSVGCSKQEEKSKTPQAIPVKLSTLEQAKLIDSDQYVGTLEATKRVGLAPKINGRILNILVKEGDIVTQGQLIAELEPTQQQEDVNAATANIQSRIAAHQQAQAELRQIQAERDSTSAEISRLKADITSAEANVKKSEADLQRLISELKLAEVNYKRSQFLVDSGVLPRQDLDDKNRDLQTSKASVEAQKKVTDALKADVKARQESLKAANSNLQAAEERITAARANVNRAMADIEQSKGNKGSIEQNLVYNRINAPITGTVGDFNQKKVGDYLNIGENLTTITNNSQFNLNINVPTENLHRLKLGLPVEIINNNGIQGIKGSITYISPLVDQNTQAVTAKATFNNDGNLRDEQYVRVRLVWNTQPGILIPTTAVSSVGGQKFVFVAKSGDSQSGNSSLVAKQVPIKVGKIQGQNYQVLSGVNPGDKIAVSRILDLKDNTPIKDDDV